MTIIRGRTRGARVRISPHEWPSPPCPNCLLCQKLSILIGFLQSLHGHAFARRIGSDGCVEIDLEPYYIKRALAGLQVVLLVNAPEKVFEVYHQDTLIKQALIKGLHGEVLPFDRYVTLIKQEARWEQRRQMMSGRSFRQLHLWA
jgi:hypothetical protein